jgi:lipopolysaccharide transport system ATP-binding protein
MSQSAVSIEHVSKKFRLYHEKNQYLKTALLRGGRAKYEDFWALKDISFEVPAGSTFGIIGSNGSGKSTLLKCLAGILTPDEGTITHRGKVVALLELGAGFHPDLSGRENIFLNGVILGMTQKEIEKKFDEIVAFSGLEEFIDTPVKNYSSGMTVRLGFAIAINVDPDILVIDEVLAVGDESFQQKSLEKIEQLRRQGKTIIFVSHGLDQVEKLCETAAWIDHGEIKMIGPALKVVNEYSGLSHGAEEATEGDMGKRWGTHEVEITDIQILDESGVSTENIQTGKSATIRIHYFAHELIEDVVAGIRITDMFGANIWGTNSKRRGTKFPPLVGEGSIDLVVQRIPLLKGSFDLSVGLRDWSEVHAYDYWGKKIQIHVTQPDIYDEGLLTTDAFWKINPPDTQG